MNHDRTHPHARRRALAGEIGKNRVSGKSPGGRIDIDLQGKGYFDKKAGEVIDTPHVHEQQLHTSPDGKSSLGSKTTRPADKNDIRTARKLAEQQGLVE